MARPPLSTFDRRVAADRLARERLDVLVIGGGITGAGVLLDAAARGLNAGLVEREDFGSGTSSKSSKLIHGGLRYLQQRELRLVHENLVERQRLLHNAPHLVHPLPFLIPLFGTGGVVDQAVVRAYSLALWLYDASGGWRIGHRHRKISAEEVSAHLPTIRHDRLVAGFVYFDARADDARLTLCLVRTAALDHGATALNHAEAVSLVRGRDGRVSGAVVAVSDLGGRTTELEVRAKVVVNAAGVWADEVATLDEPQRPGILRPAKGIHLTVPRDKLPWDTAAVVPVSGDRRSIFVIPWGEHTYIGTTDTAYSGSLDHPGIDSRDVSYLLDAVNSALSVPLRPADVTGAWAGLRPLLANVTARNRRASERTADLSRRHQVLVSPSGLVTVTGGKLTTYRKMAEDTVGAVTEQLGREQRRSPTRRMRLRGAGRRGARPERWGGRAEAGSTYRKSGADLAVSDATLGHLEGRYGSETPAVLGLAEGRPELLEPLVKGLAYLKVEALYGVGYEMASTLEDVLARRTRALLLDASACAEAAFGVARLIGAELGWDSRRADEEASSFVATVTADLACICRDSRVEL